MVDPQRPPVAVGDLDVVRLEREVGKADEAVVRCAQDLHTRSLRSDIARKPRLDEVGTDPDPRWTLANERTFLAWNQTALALIAAGIAVTQVLPPFDFPGGRFLLGLPPIALGGIISFTSYARWDAAERAMREGRPLPTSLLPKLLGLAIGCGAVVAAVLAATTTR
ncbi:MAG TPA: DUF202 domain-containing protein [Acidimicrobiales bacterium]|nr:DUF202 domain-containing protein [Acidimicrobiales bacterium]